LTTVGTGDGLVSLSTHEISPKPLELYSRHMGIVK
jgi:hypothetical protein